MEKVKCIKECVMEGSGVITTTVGKVYDLVDDFCLEGGDFCIIDDIGNLHHFPKIGDGYLIGELEYFEEV